MTIEHTYAELFKSIEGEAKYSGKPTIYVRLAGLKTKSGKYTNGCNFTCAKFNNPNNIDPLSFEALKFDPLRIPTVQDIPEISIGCDSQYAVSNLYSHMWTTVDGSTLANQLTALLPKRMNGNWSNFILSITGGEPTMHQKTIPDFINQPQFDTLNHILIETNCSIPLKPDFIQELNNWIAKKPGRFITWSNSPKLSASGEDYKKAIKPQVAIQQLGVTNCDQYFKFVCDAKEEQFVEVEQAMNDYYQGGITKDADIYIMPMSCTEDQQKEIMVGVAEMCIDRAWIYCHRIHNTVFDNKIGY